MSRLYISICRRPMTFTVPCWQIRDLSLRSTSVHMVISDSSFGSARMVLMFSASSKASLPRLIVPLIGHVSTRSPCALLSTRTNISGDAPTRNSSSPRFIRKPYGDGFRSCKRLKIVLGNDSQGSRKVCESTASKRSPRANFSLATSTIFAKWPGSYSRRRTPSGISFRLWNGVEEPSLGRSFVDSIPDEPPLKQKSYFIRHACLATWLITNRSSGM
mmetsp:Transcript_100904/g.291829  ORF Transcript_100904/g.291829 Transcript_100904/m.291829 type:complete len:217 (-) Transcript_100904:764-1414(-)